MSSADEIRERKQEYLNREIIDKGYIADDFMNFMTGLKRTCDCLIQG
jgi:hypothetical protein